MSEPLVRAPRPDETQQLREIALAAKAHWGYDRPVVREWADSLSIPEEGEEILVAEEGGRAVGWASLIPRGDVCILDDLWIEPAAMGRGVGSLLFRCVAVRARELWASSMEWDAEPNALGFYGRMGGRYLRPGTPSEWGRTLDVMGVDLS